MLAKVHSAAVLGIDSYPIEIEVNAGCGQPAVIIVGLPDAAVKESRDRVKTAIENSGFKYVMGRTTINLAPAKVKFSRKSRSLCQSKGSWRLRSVIEQRSTTSAGQWQTALSFMTDWIRPLRRSVASNWW